MKKVYKDFFCILVLTSLMTASTESAMAQHLFDNRGPSAAAGIVSTALTTAVATALVAIDAVLPLVGVPPFPPFPIVVDGRSLSHPKIYNLYWDNDWDAHNPAFSRANIDSFTTNLASSGYFGPAGQYGVGSASFIGSKQSDSATECAGTPSGTLSFLQVLGWVTCEVGAVNLLFPEIPNPFLPGAPLLTRGLNPSLSIPSLTGVLAPDNDIVYVIYLPKTVTGITQFGITNCNPYHFMSAVPETQFDPVLNPLPPFLVPAVQSFAFAVIPTGCSTSFDVLTQSASHEIIESAVDPIFLLGWIDNNVLDPNNITAIATDAEASDICEKTLTAAVRLANGISASTYWSNTDSGCVPSAPSTIETISSPNVSKLGRTFVTKQSLITLTGVAPTGSATVGDIPSVDFRFWRSGTAEPAPTTCPLFCKFVVDKNDGTDGRYSLKFKTTAGGAVEEEQSDALTVDNTPPVSTLIESPEVMVAGQRFVSSATHFAVNANDGSGVGVDSTFFRFFSGGTAPDFTKASGSFNVSGSDGPYEVDVFSTDLLGNNETAQAKAVILDNTAPQSTLTAGSPQFQGSQVFVTNTTPFTVTASDGGGVGVGSVSRRYFKAGDTAPGYVTTTASVATFNASGVDGLYEIDSFAADRLGNAETAHGKSVYLDNTPPQITITQPQSTQYPHSATLTLNYSVTDGPGSGVGRTTVLLDGNATLAGHGLSNGQSISLLTELSLGDHTFTITAVDNVGNTRPASVTFTITVTAQSITDDVNQFLSQGSIRNSGVATSLLSSLAAAASARARGKCATAANIYQAFINQIQSATGIDPSAAAILIADAQYLIAHCP